MQKACISFANSFAKEKQPGFKACLATLLIFECMGKVTLFYLLKTKVEETYLSKHTTTNSKINNWTGEEIRGFQEDLHNTLNERISERWFYTHIKPLENEKMPRIDMLNILSRYVGYENWTDFANQNEIVEEPVEAKALKRPVKLIGLLLMFGGLGIIGTYLLLNIDNKPRSHSFCFYDKDTDQPILDEQIELTVLNENESPSTLYSNENGCAEIKTYEESIQFIVKSPYYKTDTIERIINEEVGGEVVELQRDDYALMISFFANSAVEDWEKRRRQLDEMIHNDVIIFQITADNTGMEMYNKTDFIDKLTTPLPSLGEIEIIETVYKEEKISSMRFIQH